MNVSQNSDLMRYVCQIPILRAPLIFSQPEICLGSLHDLNNEAVHIRRKTLLTLSIFLRRYTFDVKRDVRSVSFPSLTLLLPVALMNPNIRSVLSESYSLTKHIFHLGELR